MILLSVVAFLVAALAAGAVVRWLGGSALVYGQAMPQRFHAGHVPRLGGLALLLGLAAAWSLGVAQSWWGDPGSLRMGLWAGLWLAVVLPSALGGMAEDMTQRLAVRFRLALTCISGLLAIFLLDMTVPRLGLPWLDALLTAVPWLGQALVLVAVAGLQVDDRALAALLVTTAAATGGFLVWNYPRGVLFAGDGGAYIWGVVIAMGSVALVQRNAEVSPWFPLLLLMYPVWETVFSMYRKMARGVSPGMADALHLHQLIYRRIVRSVFHDDDVAKDMLMRNNRTSPYLWAFTLLTVVPALLFWRSSAVLLAFCVLFGASYVVAYLAIVRFKVPGWVKR